MRQLHATVDGWLRDGRPELQPEDVREHLRQCADCRDALAEIDEVRGWFDDPGDVVADDAAAAIRFQLQTEARLAGTEKRSPEARTSRLRWVWAAAAVALLAGAGAFAAVGTSPSGDPAASRTSLATVEPLAGARFTQTSTAPDEVFEVTEGAVRVSVIRLRRGERVRVRIGADTVEVRGTRFEVEADRGALGRVSVREGHVEVRLDGGVTLMLGPGEEWRRPAPEEELAVADTSPAGAGPAARTEAPGPSQTPSSPPRPRAARPRVPVTPEPGVAPPEPAPGDTPEAAESDPETAFNDAWALYRSGRTDAAAYAFDALLRQDVGARRPDVLFWSARSHLSAGRQDIAVHHLQELLRAHPGSWHAADARTLLDRLEPAQP